MTRIAIVGGGFCGAMTAVHLVRTGAAHGARVTLFDRAARPARGVAYSTDCAAHLLNVPAARMSALPEDPDHFLRWAQAREPGVAPGDFLARRRYGEYLSEILSETAQAWPAALTIVRDQVTALATVGGARPIPDRSRLRIPAGEPELGQAHESPSSMAARLRTSSGDRHECDKVVLAPGNFPPAVPAGVAADELGDGWIGDPFDAAALTAAPRDQSVLLIGSGLTAVDVALALDAAGHRGAIVALSRRGLTPQPHVPPPIRPGLPAPLSDPPPTGGPRELTRGLRARVRAAAAAGRDWRDVVDGLRPHTQAIWRAWSAAERGRFAARLRPWWDVHRHRMAPAAAAAFNVLRSTGRVRVVAGRLNAARRLGDGIHVDITPRGQPATAALRVARVINCTGPRSDYDRIDDPLVADLRRQGLIRPDALRLGIETAADGAVLDAAGRPSDWLFTLGSPRRADLWESVAVPELRVQAADLARRLLA